MTLLLAGCRGDDPIEGESIFDTTTPVVDPSLPTASFDQWLYDHFVTPYNTRIVYRFDQQSADMDYQVTPADYEKSQLMAQLIRHLFYDVYAGQAGEEFMRRFAPRELQFVGSPMINAYHQTQVLGYASGGIKITLCNVNALPLRTTWNSREIGDLNLYYFHTMHHEFAHILHQTYTMPVAFRQTTPGTYDPMNWQMRDSVDAHQLGYVTQYASSTHSEDFVECLSSLITDGDEVWMHRIINATLPGVKPGEKEEVLGLIDSLGITGLDDPAKDWNSFTIYRDYRIGASADTAFVRYSTSFARLDPLYADYNAGYDRLIHVPVATVTSFRDYLSGWVPTSVAGQSAGMSAMLRKIDIATGWSRDKCHLHIYGLRADLRRRQDSLNAFLRDSVTIVPLGIGQ